MTTGTLVAMARVDGAIDSEVHIEGFIIKPDAAGVVQIPADHVLSLIAAGYMWAALLPNTLTRTPAQTTL